MVKNKVPNNMTLEEASEFWDEHSFLDYDDIQKVHFSVDLRKNKNYIEIKDDLVKQIRSIAYRKGTSPRILINQWLKERLEMEQHK